MGIYCGNFVIIQDSNNLVDGIFRKMLYMVGLGLGDAKDITVKGLELVKNAKEVYLEAYTSILTIGKDALV